MNWNRKTKMVGGGALLLLFALPLIASAQFEPLVGIPGVSGDGTFGDYMNALYAISISLAGLLAVVKIIIAGAKYMLTDVVTTKEDAKGDIKGALFGLLIVLAAALILTVINPQILGNSVFLEPVRTEGVSTPQQGPTNSFECRNEESCQAMYCSTSDCAATITRCEDSVGYDGHETVDTASSRMVLCKTNTTNTDTDVAGVEQEIKDNVTNPELRDIPSQLENENSPLNLVEVNGSDNSDFQKTLTRDNPESRGEFTQNCKTAGGSKVVFVKHTSNRVYPYCLGQ